MKKTLFFITLSFTCLSFITAQEVTISSNATIKVTEGASLNVFGLKLTPSDPDGFNFNENTITKSTTAIALGNESMNRVYNFTNSVTAFKGTVVFNYEDADENGITDSDAILELFDDPVWTNYPDTDNADNMVTSTIDNAINFSKITASSSSATLKVENIDDKLAFNIYPNPIVNTINITHDGAVEATLFNQLGQKVLKTNKKTIDFSSFAKGLYVLQINNLTNNKSNNFKIIKK